MSHIEALRPFQEEDLPFFMRVKKSLILYEPRMGKTVISCKIIAEDPECNTILVACSKNALSTWLDHLQTWFKEINPTFSIDIRLVRGKGSTAAAIRKGIWERPKTADVTVYLVTYKVLLNDFLILPKWLRFDTIIADEFHRALQNRANKSSEIFRKLVKVAKRFHPLSGTSVGKLGPADLWAVLNMCNPQEFSSYWNFVRTHCYVEEGAFGMEIIGVRDPVNWKLTLLRYARVRDRATHAPQMPKVQRDLLWVAPSAGQWKFYSQMEKDMVSITPDGKLHVAINSLEEFVRKRQILTCPAILDPSLGVGTAMEDLVEKMEEAREDKDEAGYHIAIFTAYKKALEPWQRYLEEKGFSVQLLHGGLEPEDLDQRIAHFRLDKGVILCTTKFAQAFSLTPAIQCFHIGWEFNPNENKQAEDRLVPQEGNFNINSWYYAYNNSDDIYYADRVTQRHEFIKRTLGNSTEEAEKILADYHANSSDDGIPY